MPETPEEEAARKAKEAKEKEAKDKQEEEARKAKETAGHSSTPQTDAGATFLDEWTEYKTEKGWTPKAKRTPAAATSEQAVGPKKHDASKCLLHPFCPYADEHA